MKTKFILLILLFSQIIITCRKDDKPVVSELRTGSNDNVIVHVYDTIFSANFGSFAFYNVDIDNNGTDDIQFKAEILGSKAFGTRSRFEVTCLKSDIQLLAFYATDTLFLSSRKVSKTVLYSDSIYRKRMYSEYTCYRTKITDSVYNINQSYRLVQLEKYDILKIDQSFKSDSFLISEEYYDYPEIVGNDGDTTIIDQKTYLNDCYTFPTCNSRYIGVRQKNNKLGWIKIFLLDRYGLLILESGIQR
jgi:hypothetical protein